VERAELRVKRKCAVLPGTARTVKRFDQSLRSGVGERRENPMFQRSIQSLRYLVEVAQHVLEE